jgi:hypothetical protein
VTPFHHDIELLMVLITLFLRVIHPKSLHLFGIAVELYLNRYRCLKMAEEQAFF